MTNEGRIDFACSRCDRSARDRPDVSDRVVEAMEAELLCPSRANWAKRVA